MYVDGTNYPKTVAPLPQTPKALGPDESKGVEPVGRDSRRVAQTNVVESPRPVGTPHDSFEHVDNSVPASTYSSDGTAESGAAVVPTRSKETADQIAVDIVDLETAVNAEGLPLLPKPKNDGVLNQEVLNPTVPAYAPGNIVDTAG